MSGSTAHQGGVSRFYLAFVGLLLLMAFLIFVPRADRFPYQGSWQAGGRVDGFTATFHFAPNGACTTDYVTDDKRLKSIPCSYVMDNGSAVVEYSYNWGKKKVNLTDCDYVWYRARLTPIEGGQTVVVRMLDGTTRRQRPGGHSINVMQDLGGMREMRFKRID